MPSTPTTFDSDCVLMLHADGADASTIITDSSDSAHTMTANAGAQLDTAQKKFGTASVLFDGDGDYLSSDESSDWSFGTGDFTIDFLVRLNSASGGFDLIGQNSSSGRWTIRRNNPGELIFEVAGSTISGSSWSPSTDTWYHIAVVRSGTTVRIFIDGAQHSFATSSHDLNQTTAVRVGYLDNSFLNGWLDEIRIVKGTAVWVANFTPPTAAYTPPASGNFFLMF